MGKKTLFVSHPSNGPENAPTFFTALHQFATTTGKIKLLWPPDLIESADKRRQELEASDIVIAEVSIASTGTGIDLGWASAIKKPIIAFHQGTTPVSPSVPPVATTIHLYITEDDVIKVLDTLV
jgi:hypothetical protein